MNTEKTRGDICSGKSPISEPISASETLAFSVLQLCKILARRENFAAALAASRRPNKCRQRLALRPGGTPQEISRGQARPAGAAPGCAAERAMPQRGIEEVFGGVLPAAMPPPLVVSGHFLRCPVGHGVTRHGFRGRRPLGRTCPRLISCGVPPGREPGVPAPARRSAEVVRIFRRSLAAPPAATGDRPRSALAAAPPRCTTILQNPRAPRGFYGRTDGQISSLPILPFPFPCPKFPCQIQPCSQRRRPAPPSKSPVSHHARSTHHGTTVLEFSGAPLLRPTLRSFRTLRCSPPRPHDRSVS